MSKLMELIQALMNKIAPRHTYDGASLDGSADLYELERRVDPLDLRGRATSRGYEFSQSFR
jgi:hypothetical protein